MRVILIQDIDKIGKKYEIKDVADGYARNFLIPKGLVKLVTKESLKWLEIQKEIISKQAEQGLEKIQEIVSGIDGIEVLIPVKLGDKKQFFEKISQQKISDKLKEMGFEIKKSQIDLKDPIQEIGEFPIKVKFEHNLEAEIRVIVSEEGEDEK
ncbi:MAG: 50S ribosomal protein L9 [Patescibacteria group bacterium]|nr:50S ribosomal protein L9 [Patescibacteria group bacterium]